MIRALGLAIALVAMPAAAQTPRDLLTEAAFEDHGRDAALALVERARAAALAAAARNPADQDAAVIAAVALGYRAKLTGRRGDAGEARKQFEALIARFPRNPEAQIGLAAWHLGVIDRVGRFVGRVVGARQATGLHALDRAVALGGDRALFAGLGAMMLIQNDAEDPRGRAWLTSAIRAPTPTPLDRTVRRNAQAVAAALQRGDAKGASALANRLLPFGWYRPD